MATYSSNLCVYGDNKTGFPISYGFYADDPNYKTAYAFDNNSTTKWRSYLSGVNFNVATNDYIGWSFPMIPFSEPTDFERRHVRKIRLTQEGGDHMVTSVAIQRSSRDGDTNDSWSTVTVVNNLVAGFNEILLPPSAPSWGWRIVPATNPNLKWGVIAIEMFEMVDDPTITFYNDKVTIAANGSPFASSTDWAPKNAFDGSISHQSNSAQWRSMLETPAYVGFSFKTERQIRAINYVEWAGKTNSILIQSSNSLTSGWETVKQASIPVSTEIHALHFIEIPESTPKKHWRVLTESSNNGQWIVYEVEMFEVLDLNYTPPSEGEEEPPPIEEDPTTPATSLYDSATKSYKGQGIVKTETMTLDHQIQQLLLISDYNKCSFYYSLDSGVTWYTIDEGILKRITQEGNQLQIRIDLLNTDSFITALSYAWA
jgi:hypothetical protein